MSLGSYSAVAENTKLIHFIFKHTPADDCVARVNSENYHIILPHNKSINYITVIINKQYIIYKLFIIIKLNGIKKGSQTTAFNPSECNKLHPPPIYKGGNYSVLPFS